MTHLSPVTRANLHALALGFGLGLWGVVGWLAVRLVAIAVRR